MERFHNRTQKVSLERQRTFWVAERYECKDGFHTHGLMHTEAPFEVLVEAYQQMTGAKQAGSWAALNVRKYNPAKDAAKYCAKYLLKRYSDYDLLVC